jgi:hypothetical protein
MKASNDPIQRSLFTELELTLEQITEFHIEKGLRHADRVCNDPPWRTLAWDFLMKFLKENPSRSFMTEDIRSAACGHVPDPPDQRAWGGVILRASRSHIIRCVGFDRMKSKNCHANPKMVWRLSVDMSDLNVKILDNETGEFL